MSLLDMDSFCPAPWNGLYVEPTGRIDNCCISHNNIGTVPGGINNAIFGKVNTDIKTQMLGGTSPSGCAACNVRDPKATIKHGYKMLFQVDQHKEFYSSVDNYGLKYLDLRWRNTCNLSCVYCNPVLSSSWAQIEKKYQSADAEDLSDIKEFIEPNIPNLSTVYLAGGEPLLIKDNQWLLEKLIEKNPDCQVMVNTNLTQIDNNRIFDILKTMPNVQWLVSLESTGDVFNFIRRGADWNQFQNNLDTLYKNVKNPQMVGFNMVYCSLSALHIFDSIEFVHKRYKYPLFSNRISLSYIGAGTHRPANRWLDPRCMPKSTRQQARNLLESKLEEYKQDKIRSCLTNELLDIANIFDKSIDFEYNDNMFYQGLKESAQRSNLNETTTFPEFFNQEVL